MLSRKGCKSCTFICLFLGSVKVHAVLIFSLLPHSLISWKNRALRLKVGSGGNSRASHETRSWGVGAERREDWNEEDRGRPWQ